MEFIKRGNRSSEYFDENGELFSVLEGLLLLVLTDLQENGKSMISRFLNGAWRKKRAGSMGRIKNSL